MPDPLARSFYRRIREGRTGMFRRLVPVLLAWLALWALGGASLVLLARWVEAAATYRSPLLKYPPPGVATEPLVQQVVLVLVSGLRDDMSRQMPALQRLRARGASATVAVPFSAEPASWVTLVSGAEAEISDVPLSLTGKAPLRPMAPDSLFAAATRANLNAAIAAPPAWQVLLPAGQVRESFFADGEEAEPAVRDRRTAEAAEAFLNHFEPNFMLVHFVLSDETGHRIGAAGEQYRQAALHADQLIAGLEGAMDLRRSVLMVTSDQGHIGAGGHGGGEGEVRFVPLVAAGARIKPGDYGTVGQADIAPTVAALIGAAIPSASQGTVLFPMLDLSEVQRVTKVLALAEQQRELGSAYLAAVGGTLSEPALNDPLVAKSSLEVKNYESAFALAMLAAQQVPLDMRTARTTRIGRERPARAPLTLLAVGLPIAAVWLRRSLRLLVAGWIGLGIVAMQQALYLSAGHLYSFSEMPSYEWLVRTLAEHSAAALAFGGLLVIILHWRNPEPSRTRVALTFCLACLLGVYLSGIPFALGYYIYGLNMQWHINDMAWAFLELYSLTSIAVLGALAAPFAVLTALIYWLSLIGAHRLGQTRLGGRLKAIADFKFQISD